MGQRRLMTIHPVPGTLAQPLYDAVKGALTEAGVTKVWLAYEDPNIVVMADIDD